jgi:hypothetical protein
VKLRLFTGAWGRYVETFDQACAASLRWPRNREAIKSAHWTICTEEKHIERVTQIRESCGVFRGDVLKLYPGDMTAQFSSLLYQEMRKCIEEDAVFLFCLPDYVFGDGTIANLKALMVEKHTCLAVPNTRVLPSAVEAFKQPHANAQLVTHAFNHMHQTWAEAEIGKPTINSFYGGVAWKEVEPGLIAVTHHLPSSYMCQFVQSDIDFFLTQSSFSAWDHVWASKLVEEGRQRYVGSSDVAFITEVTETDKNRALNLPVSPNGCTEFYRNLLHNKTNHSMMHIFRKG